jgi:hypothetical protein
VLERLERRKGYGLKEEPGWTATGTGCPQETKVLTQKVLLPRPNPNGKST